ncbi:hypothetical protein [Corynebacterium marquesiae]|uniref:hypothetical protein n=1 Tax=Corynebacterium marquesiae TaxID=2913503 RepID=UPI0022BA3D6B|nr:hypothetical protein [Corynebacterium marquesiae]MCZ9301117.1 hypothetical protein [Corynebacterium marquesiae]
MMAFLILALAVLLGIAGGALLLYDGKQRTSTPTPSADADPSAEDPSSADPSSADPAPADATPADSASSDAAPENAASAEPADSASSVAPERAPAADPATPATEAAASAPAPESAPEPAPETPPQREPEPTDEPEPEPDGEPAPEPDLQPSHETTSEHPAPSKTHARHRPILPGTMRRERRNWAEAKGFEFMKADPYLVDEWTRGVASTGAAPKDIVAGNVYGHEMLLMDIDGVNVMAMRTGAASDMVVDFRRFDRDDAKASEDLLLAMAIEGFDVYSSDSAVTERMVDERVHVALQQMPEAVTALWMETEWVLAQTTKQARSAEWDAMLPPLALLADAARVLPPRSSATHVVRLEELDPAREIPAQPIVEAVGGAPAAGAPEFERPVIQRPEEPLQMPSRAYSETRGPVEHSALGGDEVDAIADGRERPTPDSHTARLPRQQFRAASIFDDPSDDSTSGPAPSAADTRGVDSRAAEESDPRQGE